MKKGTVIWQVAGEKRAIQKRKTKKKEFDYEKENYIFIIIYGYDKWSTVYCSAGACFRRRGGTGYV